MNVRDWLIDLAENNKADWVDGELTIIPIEEDENSNARN